jgi:hypothetical protein
MVKTGLLSAVVADVTIGELCELDKWSEERDGRDIRTGFGRLEVPGVFVEEARNGSIMALTEEIGFADGLVGEGVSKEKEEGVKSKAAARSAAMGRTGVKSIVGLRLQYRTAGSIPQFQMQSGVW